MFLLKQKTVGKPAPKTINAQNLARKYPEKERRGSAASLDCGRQSALQQKSWPLHKVQTTVFHETSHTTRFIPFIIPLFLVLFSLSLGTLFEQQVNSSSLKLTFPIDGHANNKQLSLNYLLDAKSAKITRLHTIFIVDVYTSIVGNFCVLIFKLINPRPLRLI